MKHLFLYNLGVILTIILVAAAAHGWNQMPVEAAVNLPDDQESHSL